MVVVDLVETSHAGLLSSLALPSPLGWLPALLWGQQLTLVLPRAVQLLRKWLEGGNLRADQQSNHRDPLKGGQGTKRKRNQARKEERAASEESGWDLRASRAGALGLRAVAALLRVGP